MVASSRQQATAADLSSHDHHLRDTTVRLFTHHSAPCVGSCGKFLGSNWHVGDCEWLLASNGAAGDGCRPAKELRVVAVEMESGFRIQEI